MIGRSDANSSIAVFFGSIVRGIAKTLHELCSVLNRPGYLKTGFRAPFEETRILKYYAAFGTTLT